MKEAFKKRLTIDQIFTIPNILSYIRILMIPVIIILYCTFHNYILASILVLLSGITDVVDGFIARKFNMVSDFGKFIDPVADKLTQIAMVVCVTFTHAWMISIVIIIVIKDIIQFILGYFLFKRKEVVNSAKWYGKLCTVVIYLAMFIIFMFPDLKVEYISLLGVICLGVLLMALILYCRFYYVQFKNKDENK